MDPTAIPTDEEIRAKLLHQLASLNPPRVNVVVEDRAIRFVPAPADGEYLLREDLVMLLVAFLQKKRIISAEQKTVPAVRARIETILSESVQFHSAHVACAIDAAGKRYEPCIERFSGGNLALFHDAWRPAFTALVYAITKAAKRAIPS